MEDAADPLHIHVLSFLTAEERNEIPDDILATMTSAAVNFEDLTRKVHGYINQKRKDRIAHEGQVRTLEGQLNELRESYNIANDQLNKKRKTSEEYVEKYRSSLATIDQLEANLQNIQSSFNETSQKLATVTAEKEGLVTVLERRMKEIEDLNDDKKILSEQLHSTTGAKLAALAKIEEFKSRHIDLDYKIRDVQLRLDAIKREAARFRSEKEAFAAGLRQSELGLHSAVVENGNEIRNELDSLREELAGTSRQKILLEVELSELKAGNEGRDREIERLTTAIAELEKLNTSLRDQLLSLSTQLEGKRNLETPGGMDTSFSSTTEASFIEDEEKSRSTEQWVQLLQYMRRQKEISYGKLEVSKSTVARLESQLEFSERQCKELEEKYNQLQSQSQTSLITSSETAEPSRLIETLSALTDSNRVLREERENLVHQVEALNAAGCGFSTQQIIQLGSIAVPAPSVQNAATQTSTHSSVPAFRSAEDMDTSSGV